MRADACIRHRSNGGRRCAVLSATTHGQSKHAPQHVPQEARERRRVKERFFCALPPPENGTHAFPGALCTPAIQRRYLFFFGVQRVGVTPSPRHEQQGGTQGVEHCPRTGVARVLRTTPGTPHRQKSPRLPPILAVRRRRRSSRGGSPKERRRRRRMNIIRGRRSIIIVIRIRMTGQRFAWRSGGSLGRQRRAARRPHPLAGSGCGAPAQHLALSQPRPRASS